MAEALDSAAGSVDSSQHISAELAQRFERAGAWGSTALMLIGAAVLLGWAFDVEVLKRVLPSFAPMKPNTALAFVLLGGGLRIAGGERHVMARHVLAITVTAIGTLTNFQYLWNVDLGIDELLFQSAAPGHPLRISIATSTSLMCLGSALLLLDARGRVRVSQPLAALAFVIGMLAILGYVFDVRSLYRLGPFAQIAFHASVATLIASLSVLMVRPRTGIMRLVISDTDAGALVRRLIPLLVIYPVVVAWLRLLGQRKGLYDTSFGVVILTLANVGGLAVVTWLIAASLHRSELERRWTQHSLARAMVRLQVLSDSSRDFAAVTTDFDALIDVIARTLSHELGEICSVRLLSPDHEALNARGSCVYHPDPEIQALAREVLGGSPQRVGEGFSGRVAATGVAILIPSISTADVIKQLPAQMHPLVERLAVRSVLCVPLKAQNRILGVIGMSRRDQRDPYTDDDLRFAQDLADRAALAIENAALLEDLSMRVAELKKAEERFRALVESAPDAMVMIDGAGRVALVNAQAEAFFGYRRAEIVGQSIELLVPERYHSTHATLRQGFSAQPKIRHVMAQGTELFGRRKDGSEFAAEITLSPIETPEGVWVAASVRDVTERKRLDELRRKNEELLEQSRRADEANRLKSEFLANMSHELRTPLNAITGFSKLMLAGKCGPMSDTQKEYLGDISNSAAHLLQLINDILDLAKVEAGHREVQVERVDLARVASEVLDILRGLASERRTRLVVNVDPALGSVLVDARMLKQILYNYLSNAIKFTSDGGLVTLRMAPEGDSRFRLAVDDNGIGIKPEDLGRLFTEFQQLDQGTAKKYQGTGLGLALTKRLVEAQDGYVEVQSVVGQGSTFSAVLPRAVESRRTS